MGRTSRIVAGYIRCQALLPNAMATLARVLLLCWLSCRQHDGGRLTVRTKPPKPKPNGQF